VFTSQATFENAHRFYADVKGRMSKYGRNPDHLLILPGVVVFVGRTAEEAEQKYEKLNSLVHLSTALALIKERIGGIDLAAYPLDGPVPELEGNRVRMTTPPALAQLAKRENLSIRQVAMRYSAARTHFMVRGTPSQVVDQLEHWFQNAAADGFNFLPPYLPGSLNDFVDLVVPELQRRGLFRREYEGKTLRENLGLPRPQRRSWSVSAPRQPTLEEVR
jgi:N-acetyl-S-(2-succino)cysteine monooxygenase